MDQLHRKKQKLISDLKRIGRLAVAFSAGVDSTFLLRTAYDALGDNVIAITGKTVSFPAREYLDAEAFCEELGVRHVTVEIDQMAVDGFRLNPPDRCYHCKKALFTVFLREARARGVDVLAEGSNQDDLGDYRPGMRAIRELEVISPLLGAELTKDDIRRLSREMNLPTWDKPAYACLATRVPCGEEITTGKLAMVERAEEALFELGFRQLRVRHHGDLARVEIDSSEMGRILNVEMTAEVSRRLKEIGFRYVTLDLGGYQMGSMNKI